MSSFVGFRTLLGTASILAAAGGAQAQTAPAPASSVYTLGELQVTARQPDQVSLSGTAIPAAELEAFHIRTVQQALNLIPGTVGSQTGGPRNEGVIYVRGFDRFETTISIDGIRVYLPADNRLDLNRFLTEDLSEVQVAKGYVSVINGPGAMGGAINLVTRKPDKPLVAELWASGGFDNNGSANGYDVAGVVGTRQDRYYLQISGARDDYSHFRLAHDFQPTSVQPAGDRQHSYQRDWRINFKAGLTPNATDEYSINYLKQEGAKGAPYAIYDPIATQRYWDWPVWNIASLYGLSHTQLTEKVFLDGKAYYNWLDNALFSYSDPAQTRMTTPKAFQSHYNDRSFGGSVLLGAELPGQTVRALFDVREDRHTQVQTSFAPVFTQPPQTSVEDIYSVALADTLHPLARLDIDLGVSYDWRHLKRAEDYNNGLIHYPLADSHALNGQAAATYHLSDTARVYADVSDRTRFPTLFDRFSSRFGGAISNPGLRPERAVNWEVGGAAQLTPALQAEGAVFYSDVHDMIVSVPLIFRGTAVVQSQNVGSGRYYGWEVSLKAQPVPALGLGANYTYIRREVTNPATPGFQLTGVPHNKAFLYADWQALPAFSVTPSLDIASNRGSANTAGTAYFQTGAYVLANLGLRWRVTEHIEALAGLKNIFDRNYQLAYGFPEPGRTAYDTLHLHL
jgi:iron complex outermembrane receptor protein